jgi:HAD superfamily phosphatase (TIGR01668 family)
MSTHLIKNTINTTLSEKPENSLFLYKNTPSQEFPANLIPQNTQPSDTYSLNTSKNQSIFRATHTLKEKHKLAETIIKNGYKAAIFDMDDTLRKIMRTGIDPELVAQLKVLQKAGISIGIASNNPSKSMIADMKRVLEENGLHQIPIRGNSQKPSNLATASLLQGFGVSAKNAVMVGDGLFTDILGGNIAGMATIRVKYFQPKQWQRARAAAADVATIVVNPLLSSFKSYQSAFERVLIANLRPILLK